MKNSLKLSRYLPHHYQDNVYNDYPGNERTKKKKLFLIFFYLFIYLIRNKIFINMCWLWLSNLWSIFIKSRTRSWMAYSMFKMFWMWTIFRWKYNMFCTWWKNFLQIWLYTVRINSFLYTDKRVLLEKIITNDNHLSSKKINTLQIAYVSSRQTTLFDKNGRWLFS